MENGKGSRGLNTRHQAEQREEQILLALHRFGWLRARDIGALLWPTGTPGSALRMAQRTLARLTAQRYVAVIAEHLGVPAYGLTNAGARHLQAEWNPAQRVRPADTKKDICRTFKHRAKSNEVVIWWETKKPAGGAARAWTEHELVHHRAPISRRRDSQHVQGEKIPDGLLSVAPAKEGGNVRLLWLEVEQAYKKRQDRRQLVAELAGIVGEYGTNWQEPRAHP